MGSVCYALSPAPERSSIGIGVAATGASNPAARLVEAGTGHGIGTPHYREALTTRWLDKHICMPHAYMMTSYLGNLLGALSLTVTDVVQEAVQGAVGQGGHVADALVLMALRPGCSISALAARLRLSHPGAVRLIDRLTSLGWAERTKGKDRRKVRLHLTPAGLEKLAEVRAGRGDCLAGAVGALTVEQQAALEPIAQALLRHLTRDLVAAYANCRLCDVPACEARGCPVDAEARTRFTPTDGVQS